MSFKERVCAIRKIETRSPSSRGRHRPPEESPALVYSAGIARQDAEQEVDLGIGDTVVAMPSAAEGGISVHQTTNAMGNSKGRWYPKAFKGSTCLPDLIRSLATLALSGSTAIQISIGEIT